MRYTNIATYGLGALLLAVVFANSACAQTVYPYSSWGGSSANYPFNLDPSWGVRYQVVYGSQEAGMAAINSGGVITSLEFSVHSANWNTAVLMLNNCVVRIGYTDKDYVPGANALSSTNMDLNFKTNSYIATCIQENYQVTKVQYPGWPTTFQAPGHILKFVLRRPFAFNGGGASDNILVDISFTSRTPNAGLLLFGNSGRRVVYASGAGVSSTTQTGTVSDFGNSYVGLVCTVTPNLDVEPRWNIFSTQDWPVGRSTVTTPANATGPGASNWVGDGLLVGDFDIVNCFQNNPATLTKIQIEDRSLPGDSRTAFTNPQSPPASPGNEYGVRLWEDGPPGAPDGAFDPLSDIPIYDPAISPIPGKNFTLDDNFVEFDVPTARQSFVGGQSRKYFIVVKLAGAEPGSLTPEPGDKYQFRVKSLTVGSGVGVTGVPGAPESCYPYFPGIFVEIPTFTYTDIYLGVQTCYLNSQNNVIQSFSVDYDRGPLNYQNSMTLAAPVDITPTDGDDSVDYAGIRLALDNDANNQWTPGVDVVVSTIAANHFPMDDSSVTFIIPTGPGQAGEFLAPVTKRFIVLVDFNTIGARGSTYMCQITAASGHQFGAQVAGVPCPAVPTPGLVLEGNDLLCERIGPALPELPVSNISQGPNGWGELLLVIEIGSLNRDWSVTDIVFTCTGVGAAANPATAFSDVALYEDLNSNSPNFDGPAIDQLATALTGSFSPTSPTTAEYSATITNQGFPSTIVRTFYLRVKLAGNALFGQRYYANVTDVTWNLAPSGSMIDLQPQPPLTNGILIDAPTLTVSAAPTSPISSIAESGVAFGHTIAVFRFQAENEDINVSGLTLTTGGTGDFFTDLATSNGIEIYLDSELLPAVPKDGMFTPGVDVLLGQSGGNYPTAAVPFNVSGPIVIPNGQYYDLIIRYNILATAGASLPETFRCSISSPSDILTAGTNAVTFGIPQPISNTVGVIVYFVSSFSPTESLRTGGEPIVIIGAGFTPPVSVTIGGIPCPGEPIINGDGTGITGLFTPAGDGLELTIILTTGALGSREVPQTFNYATASIVDEHEARISSNACAVENSTAQTAMAAVLALMAMLAGASWMTRSRKS
ncbi:MAG: IPT/TIG domain-containing protein [Planctomycetes bacterium]|nr:IPT/TIG domain-containing protein [Planctomycetota bacterium]